MREIKTRVWVNGEPLFFDSLDEIAAEGYQCGVSDFSDAELFTGLRDVNGVEIYEGDIVNDHVGRGVVKYSEKHGAFRICYGDGMAKWFYDYLLNGERDSIEVIGNIHQNPELLQ